MTKRPYSLKDVFIACVLTTFAFGGCGSSGKIYSQYDIKSRLLKKYQIKEDWKKLEIYPFSFSESDAKKGLFFGMPKDLAIQNDEYLFVVDNNLHKVFRFSFDGNFIEMFGKPGQGPGELYYPNRIIGTRNRIYIQDGRGINIYDGKFGFIKNFMAFGPIQNFFVTSDDQHIFTNNVHPNEEKESLIEKYDTDGVIEKRFGKRFMRKDHNSYDSRCYLSGDEEEIIAAFYSYPLIRRYTREGELIGEFRIKLSILEELEKLNYDKNFTNPAPNTLNLPLLLAGAKLYENHIYVLLYLPRLEILEFEKNGVLTGHFYCPEFNDIFALEGFGVSRFKNNLTFYVLYAKEEDHLYNVLRACPSDKSNSSRNSRR